VLLAHLKFSCLLTFILSFIFQDSFFKHLNFHSFFIIFFLVSKHILFVQNFHILQLPTLLFISSLAFNFFYLLFLALHFVSCVFLKLLCVIKARHIKIFLIFFIFETITLIVCC
jgi:hypothetical protein